MRAGQYGTLSGTLSSQFKRAGIEIASMSVSLSVNGGTRVVGVFGYPVEHSLSPAMHNSAFGALHLPYIYVPFCVAPSNLQSAIGSLKSLGIIGVNLTIPHKEAVLPHLDEVTQVAREVGAVNTVHCTEGRLVGDNTDGYGFFTPLVEAGWSVSGCTVFVVGAGGAARSVVFRLAREGAHVVVMNRSRDRALRLAESVVNAGYAAIDVVDADDAPSVFRAVRECKILVQTTRVGMYPHVEQRPDVPLAALTGEQLVYDLVYNPVETALLREARNKGCSTMTGVKMLVYQGAAAFHRWTGEWPPVDVMEQSVLECLA